MRILFMIFTTAERSCNILTLCATTFVRHNSYQNKLSSTREGARLIVRRLQRQVLRILRDPDPDYTMDQEMPSFQQKPGESEASTDESKFSSHRKNKKDNCRTCNDFKSWSKQQRLLSNTQASKEKHMASGKITVNTVNAAEPRDDCPMDKERLGISTWGLLHTMAAFYSDNPTDSEKRDMKTFFEVLSRLYPCEYCAKDFRADLDVNPINVNSQKDLTLWLCKFHNRVNEKLGKPMFDCTKVNERWRDGWLDGSCD